MKRFVMTYAQFESEILTGGLADQKSIESIAKLHNTSIEDLKMQLDKGIEVELEHTDDRGKAEEIAKDHLVENPKYYDKLEKIEDH
jgi:hypothetical protein